ncbi:integral membrane [Pyrenophora seminiperda CCB06]|uniref:Integral membrane n=1 Tax=Pyrenophora seminiperda CCB06 TaxID=1302712 RepID=A0A3M7MJM4_9PLEO|nr:integral membrane [Pyrenophora seminiperda CCB06]
MLTHMRALVGRYGTYTTLRDTNIFCRAPAPQLHSSTAAPSATKVFRSLGAAQESINSTQLDGATKDDLLFFHHLWEITITVLEEITSCSSLPEEPFGWGIFGLSAGYIHPPSKDLIDQNKFDHHKYRLHAALKGLPSLDEKRKSEYEFTKKTSTAVLVKARREVHIMGRILLSRFRQDEWKRVRWYHAVAVAERWIEAFGLVPREEGKEGK